MDKLRKYYETLGINPGASWEEIKQAYRDSVSVWHPDRFTNNERLQQKAQEKLREINEAHEKLNAFFRDYGVPNFGINDYTQRTDKKPEDKKNGFSSNIKASSNSPAGSQKQTKKSEAFYNNKLGFSLNRLWLGGYSLPVSFWVFNVLTMGVFKLVFAYVVKISKPIGWTLFGFIFIFGLICLGGIWRSSNYYNGPKIWRIIAKSSIVISILLSVTLIFSIVENLTDGHEVQPTLSQRPDLKDQIYAEHNAPNPAPAVPVVTQRKTTNKPQYAGLPDGATLLDDPQSSQYVGLPPGATLIDNPINLKPFTGKLDHVPLTTKQDKAAEDPHIAQILAKHPDAYTLVPEVEKWVATLPAKYKARYTYVLDRGTAQEVISLLDIYKQAKNDAILNQSHETLASDHAQQKMQTYTITHPDTGKTITIKSSSPPDDAAIDRAIAIMDGK